MEKNWLFTLIVGWELKWTFWLHFIKYSLDSACQIDSLSIFELRIRILTECNSNITIEYIESAISNNRVNYPDDFKIYKQLMIKMIVNCKFSKLLFCTRARDRFSGCARLFRCMCSAAFVFDWSCKNEISIVLFLLIAFR